MLGALKYFIRLISIPLLYIGGVLSMLYTMFRDAKVGLFLLVVLIPQPNLWYKLHSYPYGKDFLDLLFIAILCGIVIQKQGFARSDNAWIIMIFILVSYFALWNSSMRFSLPLPITRENILLMDWKNYAQMIFLYFFALNLAKTEDDQKVIIVIMSIVILLIAVKSYRNFSGGDAFRYDKRYGGPFEAVGLGANHLGAFAAHFCSLFLGLFYFDGNKKRRWLFLATVLYGLHPLFFSYSRGAYLAFLFVMTFFGLIKKRSLLVIVATLLLIWQAVLPPSVVDRIMMTKTEEGEIEHSAAGRIELWQFAIAQFQSNPVFGIGYGGYALSVGGHTLSTGEKVPEGFDTHSFWMKILCEQGVIGGGLFLFILVRAFQSGAQLYRTANSNLYKGLGFGFMGCVLAMCITNMFGDRWSYFALGGYFWIFWGLVDRAIINSRSAEQLG